MSKTPGYFRSFYLHLRKQPLYSRLVYCGGIILLWGISSGCQDKGRPLTYRGYSSKVQKHVDQICQNVAVTHFVVENRQVLLKEKNSSEVLSLRAYQTNLSNGYYYCSSKIQKSNLE